MHDNTSTGTTITTREWVHPSTGEVRRYIANIPEIIDLDIVRYKTGNIKAATLRDEVISNSEANRILSAVRSARYYLDDTGELHFYNPNNRYNGYREPREITMLDIANAVLDAIDA